MKRGQITKDLLTRNDKPIAILMMGVTVDTYVAGPAVDGN